MDLCLLGMLDGFVLITVMILHTWAVSCEKVPKVLSRCHTKRRSGARGRFHPSFGMTPTFPKKKKEI